MKRTKEQPSLAGLLLIVTGMLLLSMLVMGLLSAGNLASENVKIMIGLGAGAIGCLAVGATLSGRKRR